MLGSWTRLFASALAIIGIGSANGILISEEQLLNQTYDYIIVGGGTSGLTVANRLTENGKKTVLVVEYGTFDDDPNILLPGGAMRGSLRRMYNITSLPIAGLNNRTAGVSAGAVVGGGSAVNGMFFDRGAKSDYDAWERLGNAGWGWKDILPYFKKSVTFTPPTEEVAKKYEYTWDIESAYGGSGPIHVSFPPYQFPGMDYVWRAWKEFGVKKPKEAANGEAIGAIQAPSALDPVKRTRSYARTAHYEPYKNRTNYHLLTGYQVTEIRFVRDLRAVGVNVVKRGTNKKIAIQAHRETIIAAGALWTPWLLQRSGIGPRQVLEAAGITVKKDMPGVGANFQDHAVGYGSWAWTNASFWPTGQTLLTNRTFAEEAQKEYDEHRTGPLTIATGNQAAFLPLKTVASNWESIVDAVVKQNVTQYLPKTYDANLTEGYRQQHRLISDLLTRDDSAAYEFAFGVGPISGAALMRPLSRGTVNINPANPLGPPLVDYRTFSNPVDVQQAIQSIHFVRRVNSVSTFAELVPVERAPGINVTSDEALSRHVRNSFNPSFAHPSGTASMMPEEYGGVVRPDLRIWQTRKLSVVDASIMPFIPATHICTTVYAVAERAAQYIKERTDWDGP